MTWVPREPDGTPKHYFYYIVGAIFVAAIALIIYALASGHG